MLTQRIKKVFEPVAMVLIVAGIIGLIQPIGIEIFRWGFNILWVGLVIYMLVSHFKS